MDSSISKRTLRHGSFFREPTLIALQTMRAHKLRSFLMLLGIILSVSTLILVVALISGMNGYFASRVANLGSNVLSGRQVSHHQRFQGTAEGNAP